MEGKSEEVATLLADFQTEVQKYIAQEWWALADMLIVRYNDQYFNFGPNAPLEAASIGYPAFWLDMAGFRDNSFYPGWMQPSIEPPSLLSEKELFAARQTAKLASSCDAIGAKAGRCGDTAKASLTSTQLSTSPQVGEKLAASLHNYVFVIVYVSIGVAIGFATGHRVGSRRSVVDISMASTDYLRVA